MSVALLGNPAKRLKGSTLDGGWTVGNQLIIGRHSVNGTGGTFSVAYEVTDGNGKKAFLKALDYSKAMTSPHPAEALLHLTAAFKFECDVLEKIGSRYLDRVVRAITSGKTTIDEENDKGVVEYLIFELADGDVRKHLTTFSGRFDVAWRLRSLQHISVGLRQLHTSGIIHQDTKPSNVLVFEGRVSKLGDLGRSSYDGHITLHDQLPFAGDPQYVPIDLAYGFIPTDWNQRKACDLYHLGSMAVFFFSGVAMTPMIASFLEEDLRSRSLGGTWSGSFEHALPFIRNAFEKSIEEFAAQIKDDQLRLELSSIVRQLCEPDPLRRGHLQSITPRGNTYSLERFNTKLDLLATRAEYGTFCE